MTMADEDHLVWDQQSQFDPLKSTLVVDQANHAAEDDLRKKFQTMEIQFQLMLKGKVEFEQTFEHFKKQFAKPSDRINEMERSIKGIKEGMTLLQKSQDDFGKNLKSNMEDLRQDVDQIKTQRKDDTDIVDSISKRQDVLEEHIKNQAKQIKDNETQIKVQGEQIKVQREQIKVQGEQINKNETQIKDNQIRSDNNQELVATTIDQTPARKKDHLRYANKGKLQYYSPPLVEAFSTSTPVSTLGGSHEQQDESGYCGTPQEDSSINDGQT